MDVDLAAARGEEPTTVRKGGQEGTIRTDYGREIPGGLAGLLQ